MVLGLKEGLVKCATVLLKVWSYYCTLSHSCWRGTGFLASRHAQTISNKTLIYVKKNYISCTAEHLVVYIATICTVQLFGAVAALLYGDLAKQKTALLLFFLRLEAEI